jgi:TolB-like protein
LAASWARYVLDGTVQRTGNKLRVNAQLIDAENDVYLWAERFDRDTSDLFALQNEITPHSPDEAEIFSALAAIIR